MIKYHLAKLVDWVGNLETRKRMQKIVYLLQAAGCPFEADFFLHRFGPYSQDVARITDELVAIGILEETASENQVGRQFSYCLTTSGREKIAALEAKPDTQEYCDRLSVFGDLAKDLAATGLRDLEVASTMAYYHHDLGLDWDQAKVSACSFKSVDPDGAFALKALKLAQRVSIK